jgi:hypothetical protein
MFSNWFSGDECGQYRMSPYKQRAPTRATSPEISMIGLTVKYRWSESETTTNPARSGAIIDGHRKQPVLL